MASKQEINKMSQGYNPKPVQRMCSNCKSFNLEIEEITTSWDGSVYHKETNIHCLIGGFAVKKMGNCNRHEFKDAET